MLGPLSAVQNISRYPQASIIRWIAPFSLNITNAEPDIVYCIDITNITCDSERKDPIISMCGLLETYYYNESILNKADLFEISITPKSNAIGSEDGISNRVRGIDPCMCKSIKIPTYEYR